MASFDCDRAPRRCVYTALIGRYEKLNEQAVAAQSGIPFICLTDDAELHSESWQIRKVSPVFAMDPIRSQRDFKLRPHLHLPEFDQTLYIDNSVVLSEPPERLFEQYLSGAPFAIAEHSFRDRVLDEFIAVAAIGLDDQARIFEQLNHYELIDGDVLQEKPYWGAILLRDVRDGHVRTMSEIWMAQVNRYSRRDQLSVNLAFRLAGLTPAAMRIDNHASWFHSWPVAEGRDGNGGMRAPSASHKPLIARLRELELALAEQQQRHEAALGEQRRQHDAAVAELADAHEQAQTDLERRRDLAKAEDAGHHDTALTEQARRHDAALAEALAWHERLLAEERQQRSALLLSPGGRIAAALSRIAHRYPRRARILWRIALALARFPFGRNWLNDKNSR